MYLKVNMILNSDGIFQALPKIGTSNATNFLLTCLNWKDDNTISLNYAISYIDENSNGKDI